MVTENDLDDFNTDDLLKMHERAVIGKGVLYTNEEFAVLSDTLDGFSKRITHINEWLLNECTVQDLPYVDRYLELANMAQKGYDSYMQLLADVEGGELKVSDKLLKKLFIRSASALTTVFCMLSEVKSFLRKEYPITIH